MSRDSEFSSKICGQCADICEACASERDKFDMDMSKQCAKVCRTCDGKNVVRCLDHIHDMY